MNKRRTETRQIESLLRGAMPKAEIEAYRYNSASIRVRMVDEQFEHKSLIQREKRVLPILRELLDDVLSDITLLLLITPKEQREILDGEFDDPTPSRF